MTKRARTTQAAVRRIIRAALKEGLHIKGIKPDGTIMVDDAVSSIVPSDNGLDGVVATRSDWEDVEA